MRGSILLAYILPRGSRRDLSGGPNRNRVDSDLSGVNVTSSRLFFPYIFSLYVVNPKKMAIFLEFPNI